MLLSGYGVICYCSVANTGIILIRSHQTAQTAHCAVVQISLGPTCNGFDAFDEDEEEEAEKHNRVQCQAGCSVLLKGNVWTAGALTKERKLSEKVVGHIHR